MRLFGQHRGRLVVQWSTLRNFVETWLKVFRSVSSFLRLLLILPSLRLNLFTNPRIHRLLTRRCVSYTTYGQQEVVNVPSWGRRFLYRQKLGVSCHPFDFETHCMEPLWCFVSSTGGEVSDSTWNSQNNKYIFFLPFFHLFSLLIRLFCLLTWSRRPQTQAPATQY